MFNVGDLVMLKSGGPVMTVIQVDGSNVYCTWFDERNVIQRHVFVAGALESAG